MTERLPMEINVRESAGVSVLEVHGRLTIGEPSDQLRVGTNILLRKYALLPFEEFRGNSFAKKPTRPFSIPPAPVLPTLSVFRTRPLPESPRPPKPAHLFSGAASSTPARTSRSASRACS